MPRYMVITNIKTRLSKCVPMDLTPIGDLNIIHNFYEAHTDYSVSYK